jgi:peptide-methionine (R)-S-oxide reductase
MAFDRRTVVTGVGASMLFAACSKPAAAKAFRYALSDAEWRKKLTPQEYRVLRQAATERPYSSPLNDEHRAGTFVCAGCAQRLYSSSTKFESGTGWPSFYAPINGGIATATDRKIGFVRTEIHCARCGGHLGHVFDDGPKPTGKRYCMNGVAMDFRPA